MARGNLGDLSPLRLATCLHSSYVELRQLLLLCWDSLSAVMAFLSEPWQWNDGDPEEIYFLEEEIASGTFGSVYKAIHNETGEVVALKIMTPEEDPDDVDQLVELWILKQCDHPNISRLIGTWKRGDETFVRFFSCVMDQKPLQFALLSLP